MKRYYHIYTKGLEDDVIFRAEEDYIVGMNYVPVVLYSKDILMLAFVLMSNHFHFVAYSGEHVAYEFINLYKTLISRYMFEKYGVRELLRKVSVGVSVIADDKDALMDKIAYALNNPIAAGINCFATGYEWGSGRCYFAGMNYSDTSVPLKSYSIRAQRKLLHSHIKLPQNYLVTSRGYVDPISYVDWPSVERLFHTALSLQYHLNMSRKNNNPSRYSLSFSDELLFNVVSQMLDKQYGGLSVSELSQESLSFLVKDLNRRFNSSPKQLARILKLPLQLVVSILKC